MTKIEISKDRAGCYRRIVCMGHAGYAKRRLFGREPDILCAAISILVIGTMNSLEELAGERFEAVTDEKTGFMKFDFPPGEPLRDRSVFLLDSMVYNLERLSEQYGSRYLKVEFREV